MSIQTAKRWLQTLASVASKEQSDFEVFIKCPSITLTLIETTGYQPQTISWLGQRYGFKIEVIGHRVILMCKMVRL